MGGDGPVTSNKLSTQIQSPKAEPNTPGELGADVLDAIIAATSAQALAGAAKAAAGIGRLDRTPAVVLEKSPLTGLNGKDCFGGNCNSVLQSIGKGPASADVVAGLGGNSASSAHAELVQAIREGALGGVAVDSTRIEIGDPKPGRTVAGLDLNGLDRWSDGRLDNALGLSKEPRDMDPGFIHDPDANDPLARSLREAQRQQKTESIRTQKGNRSVDELMTDYLLQLRDTEEGPARTLVNREPSRYSQFAAGRHTESYTYSGLDKPGANRVDITVERGSDGTYSITLDHVNYDGSTKPASKSSVGSESFKVDKDGKLIGGTPDQQKRLDEVMAFMRETTPLSTQEVINARTPVLLSGE